MPRKIALVGTHPSGIGAPFNDPSWEVWGVSARADYFTRADRWYEIHRIDGTFEGPGEADHWRGELRKQCAERLIGQPQSGPVPIYMIYPDPVGEIREFPHQALMDRFGSFFMTSTFSWMTSAAIAELCPPLTFAEPGSAIGIWGIEMEYGTEYRHQRNGFRHFLKVAEHLGINIVRRPAGGLIYEPVPYPFWQDDPVLCKLAERNKEAVKKANAKEASMLATRELIAHNRGQQEALNKLNETWQGSDSSLITDRLEQLKNAHSNLMLLLADQTKETVYWQAIDGEQKFWLDYFSP